MKIYIVKDDMRLGPFTLEEVKRQGISADTLVWFKGMPDWKEARAIPELAGAYIPDIPPATDLSAQATSDGKISLTWNSVNEPADGWITSLA